MKSKFIVVLICIFMITNEICYIFMHLLPVANFVLWGYACIIFACFSIGVSFAFICEDSLYILDTND